MEERLKSLIGQSEKILWEGRPNKKCFIYEAIFNPLLPFAIVWAIFDLGFIGNAMSMEENGGFLLFLIPFMLLHMMPVWLYLGGAFFSFRRYKNTYYIVTDYGIYTSSGAFTKNIQNKQFTEASQVTLHQGFFDQKFDVGDVVVTSNQQIAEGQVATIKIESISEYTEVYSLIQKLQKDIYTDIMYPNDMRPKENHGYNTEYKG